MRGERGQGRRRNIDRGCGRSHPGKGRDDSAQLDGRDAWREKVATPHRSRLQDGRRGNAGDERQGTKGAKGSGRPSQEARRQSELLGDRRNSEHTSSGSGGADFSEGEERLSRMQGRASAAQNGGSELGVGRGRC